MAPSTTSHRSTDHPTTRPWHWGAATVLLTVHAALAIDTLRRKSVTVDEVAHLPAGISYWQTATFELYHHNPPLVKLLAALPALATQPTVDYLKSWSANKQQGLPLNQWAFGWEFMHANAAKYHEIYFWARLPVVAISILAGVVIFLWAREVFGPMAGLIGLALWTWCPNSIAHAGLVTTDMGATSIGFVATYLFRRYLQHPTWARATAAGVVLGLAELTKFSLLLLYLLWPALWVVWMVWRPKHGASPPSAGGYPSWRELSRLAVLLLISVLVINFGYGFEKTGTRLGDFTFLSRSLTRPRVSRSAPPAIHPLHPWPDRVVQRQNRFYGTGLAGLPVPLPRHYVEGFDEQKLESEGIDGQGYPVFLCGELRRTGWWWYYFFTLAVKVPLGTWLLTIAAPLVAWMFPPARARLADELVLMAPPALVLVVMSFFTDINLGLRYVLPVFPFWFVLLSRVACCFKGRHVAVAVATLLPLAWNVAACLRVHPDHLAYFNELAGGPKQGHRYLIDSNLDWGQDLLELAAWLEKHRPGQRVGLAYFGNVDPSILAASGRAISFNIAPPRRLDDLRLLAIGEGSTLWELRNQWIESHLDELQTWLTTQQAAGWSVRPNDHPGLRSAIFRELDQHAGPQPGLFAVSANLLMGLPFRLRDQFGSIWNAEQDAFGYFRELTPIDRAGVSIFIYELTAADANALRDMLTAADANALRAKWGLAPL